MTFTDIMVNFLIQLGFSLIITPIITLSRFYTDYRDSIKCKFSATADNKKIDNKNNRPFLWLPTTLIVTSSIEDYSFLILHYLYYKTDN